MRARASNLMIGTLTLALIAGSLGAFLGYQKLAGIKQKTPFRVIFEGSASGLRKGGSVNFAGIRVGEVVSLKLDHPRRVVALAMIDGNTPVKSDTQVGLEFQGLTGIAAISFTGGSDEAPPPPKGAGRHSRADRRSGRDAQHAGKDPRGAAQRRQGDRRQ